MMNITHTSHVFVCSEFRRVQFVPGHFYPHFSFHSYIQTFFVPQVTITAAELTAVRAECDMLKTSLTAAEQREHALQQRLTSATNDASEVSTLSCLLRLSYAITSHQFFASLTTSIFALFAPLHGFILVTTSKFLYRHALCSLNSLHKPSINDMSFSIVRPIPLTTSRSALFASSV